LLVDRESPEALAEGIERLVRNPDLRRSMGAEGRRVALTEYTAEVYARRHLRLYQDLVARRHPRGVDEAPERDDLPNHVEEPTGLASPKQQPEHAMR
jgi:hypothetical protein